jgi:ABC-type Fe3+-hydroxamate transport system substrate-binding protein
VPAESIADVLAALSRIGALLGAEGAAAEWRARIEESLRPRGEETIRGLFVVERQSLTVAGGGSFVDPMLRAAGIANVCGGEAWSYRRIELERILALDPVIILDASFDDARPAEFWGRFPELRAVREGRVHRFPPVRPGVGIPGWIEELRTARARRE